MKERPIIFSGEMVRAILDGRKTQTRRPVKPQPDIDGMHDCRKYPMHIDDFEGGWAGNFEGETRRIKCPYGQPGDRLWVRETWAQDPCEQSKDDWIGYLSTDSADELADCRIRPSIHMPRWASRITLEILDVRVERVQDLSEDDAKAEGAIFCSGDCETGMDEFNGWICGFKNLWNTVYGPDAWDRNDWVWVIDFRLITS